MCYNISINKVSSKGSEVMKYGNNLEGKLAEIESELRIAEMNNWEFDIANLKEEIKEVERELEEQFNMAYEG